MKYPDCSFENGNSSLDSANEAHPIEITSRLLETFIIIIIHLKHYTGNVTQEAKYPSKLMDEPWQTQPLSAQVEVNFRHPRIPPNYQSSMAKARTKASAALSLIAWMSSKFGQVICPTLETHHCLYIYISLPAGDSQERLRSYIPA